MSEQDRRLECLKLALQRGANDPRPWREVANELTAWVEDKPHAAPPQGDQEAGKPTGRKAGGSAARQ